MPEVLFIGTLNKRIEPIRLMERPRHPFPFGAGRRSGYALGRAIHTPMQTQHSLGR